MDWSLLQPHAKKFLLRDVRGYKNPNYYYAAMILDPILRFNWIFYAIYTQDLEHSTFVSFLVAFSECTRRGFWVLFRVENEHCSNVARFKASRDVPLPYSITTDSDEDREHAQEEHTPPPDEGQTTAVSPTLSRHHTHTGAGLEAQTQDPAVAAMRNRRPTMQRSLTRIVADAHMQDFEKRRKPGVGDSDNVMNRNADGEDEDGQEQAGSSDDDEDEDEDETQDLVDVEALLRERRQGGGPGVGRA